MSFLEIMDPDSFADTSSPAPIKSQYWPAPGMPEGIPRGAVIELFGDDCEEWLWEFLNFNPELRIFWDLKKSDTTSENLIKTNAGRQRITFKSLKSLIAVTLRQVIQSQKYEIILTQNNFSDFRIFQALQIFLKKANSTLLLLGVDRKSKSSQHSLQLQIDKGVRGEWQIRQNYSYYYSHTDELQQQL